MITYRSKFRLSRISRAIKSSIVTYMKGDVPTYIANDIMDRLDNGEEEIIIPMVLNVHDKSLVEYLNEFHRNKNKTWHLDFLNMAFLFVSERIKQKLGRFSDIEIEVLELSDTDKRVVIKMK